MVEDKTFAYRLGGMSICFIATCHPIPSFPRAPILPSVSYLIPYLLSFTPPTGTQSTDSPCQPFFTLILSAGNPKLASIFIPKAAPSLQSGETIAMYEKCGMRVKAAEEAVKIKDVEAVDRLRDAAGGGTVEGMEIDKLGAGLRR